MGITIHYEGTLRTEHNLDTVKEAALGWAKQLGAKVQVVDDANATLERIIEYEERDYKGRVRGLVLNPHHGAEPLHLLFGDDLFMQDYCKTQFSSIDTHIAVVELFRILLPNFASLTVEDEGEFWETSDRMRLTTLWDGFDEALDKFRAENPDAETQVRLSSGRIIDAIG